MASFPNSAVKASVKVLQERQSGAVQASTQVTAANSWEATASDMAKFALALPRADPKFGVGLSFNRWQMGAPGLSGMSSFATKLGQVMTNCQFPPENTHGATSFSPPMWQDLTNTRLVCTCVDASWPSLTFGPDPPFRLVPVPTGNYALFKETYKMMPRFADTGEQRAFIEVLKRARADGLLKYPVQDFPEFDWVDESGFVTLRRQEPSEREAKLDSDLSDMKKTMQAMMETMNSLKQSPARKEARRPNGFIDGSQHSLPSEMFGERVGSLSPAFSGGDARGSAEEIQCG